MLLLNLRAGSLNSTSVSASKSASTSTSDSPAAKKILIFKSFSLGDSNHLANHYLKIAILSGGGLGRGLVRVLAI